MSSSTSLAHRNMAPGVDRTVRYDSPVEGLYPVGCWAGGMMDALLIRLKRFGLRVPRLLWERVIAAEARRSGRNLDWFTPDHHAVRDHAVTEIARSGNPVTVEQLAAATGLEHSRLAKVLDDLERAKTFLFRSSGDGVDWAYPVTAEDTGHRIRLDSGERFFAA